MFSVPNFGPGRARARARAKVLTSTGHAERTVINECKRVCVNKEKRGSRLYRLKSNLKPKRRKRLWAALCGRWDISFAKPNLVLSLVRPECAVRKYFTV